MRRTASWRLVALGMAVAAVVLAAVFVSSFAAAVLGFVLLFPALALLISSADRAQREVGVREREGFFESAPPSFEWDSEDQEPGAGRTR